MGDPDAPTARIAAFYPWLGLSLVLASCALLLCRVRRWLYAPGRATVLGSLRKWRARLHNMLFPECPYDPIYAKVSEIERARCVQKVRTLIRVFHWVFAATTLAWVYMQLVLGDAYEGPVEQALGMLVSYLLCAVLDAFPGLVTAWGLRAMAAFLCAAHIWTLVASDWAELPHTRYVAFSVLVRMGAAVLYTDFPVNVALNVTCFLVSCAVSPYDGVDKLESFGLFLILADAGASKSIGVAEINATLEATTSRSFLDAMVALLSNICDVVLHLSSDFRISQPSPSFATVLFKVSPHALKGDLVLDFVSDAGEASRVSAFLNRADSAAAVLHTCFKDSNNTVVRVQLFHARGVDINNRIFHVLGILESSEAQRPPPVPAGGGQAAVALPPLADTIREGHVSSAPGSDSLSGCAEVGAKYVWVDPHTDGVLVVQGSAGFAALGGPSPGADLLDSVHNKREFLQYLQHGHAQQDHAAGTGRAERSKLVLTLKRGGGSPARVSADIRKETVQQDGGPIVKLAIWNVRKARPRRAESPAGSRSPGAPRSDPKPPLWREGAPAARRPRSARRLGVDEENCCTVVANVLDERLRILDVARFGHAADPGLGAGGGLLDSFAAPVPTKLAIIGSLVRSEDLREICGLLESDSVSVEEYMRSIRPTEIGKFAMRRPGGGAPARIVDIVVLNFFTCGAGAELCCTMAIS